MAEGIRFDRAILGPNWEKTPEGFLRVKATFARTGLQRYRNPDGTERVELRPESEVARQDSLASLGSLPVTLEHPPTLLTPENCQQYQRGQSGSVVNYDSGFVQGTITLTEKEAIEAVERGDAVEVSVGYRVRYDATPGIYQGQRYDGIQRDVSGNHIAVVRRARGGSDVRLHLDSADALEASIAVDVIDSTQLSQPQEDAPMATSTRADAKKPPMEPAPQDEWEEAGESPDEEAGESLEEEDMEEEAPPVPPRGRGGRGDGNWKAKAAPSANHNGGMGSQGDACGDWKKDSLDTPETVPFALYAKALQERDDALELLEVGRGQADAISERIDALEELLDQRLDSEPDINQAVHARLQLIEKAQELTGRRPVETYDGLSDRELMVEALEQAGLDPDRFDGRSDDYVTAAFDTILEAPVQREDGAQQLLRVLNEGVIAARSDGSETPSIDAAQQQMIERTAQAYQAS